MRVHVGLSVKSPNNLGSIATGRPCHCFVVVNEEPSHPLIACQRSLDQHLWDMPTREISQLPHMNRANNARTCYVQDEMETVAEWGSSVDT